MPTRTASRARNNLPPRRSLITLEMLGQCWGIVRKLS
jgi:hypothetical protein